MEFKFLKTVNILYVEDDDSIREGYERTLERCAKELYIATDGQEGFKLFKEKQSFIDIVITDIKMPKLNGIDMIKKIQEINPNIPIIFTSAHSDSSYLFEALDIQADGYLLKPVPVKKLMTIIDKISKNIYLEIENKKQEKIIHQIEKMTAIGEMIGNIAHQWRQPLSVISTAASGLKLAYDLNDNVPKEKVLETITYIVKETKLLSTIIDDFRGFFKGEAISKNTFSIKDMCDRLDCLQFNNLQKEVSIIRDIDENLTITGNENLLIQVFINIMNNALYALDNIENTKKFIFVSIYSEDEKIKIKIKDNGGGVLDEVMDKIFEPYFTTKHQSQGTGLGLYMAYQIIIMQFAGDISVENISYEYEGKEYKGAEFTVVI